jgi:hypothetical protein
MEKSGLMGLLMFSLTSIVMAQGNECGCDVTISQSGIYRATDKVLPGQTICIKGGNYTYLHFFNYTGTPDKPIKFVNCGGQAVIESSQNPSGLAFNNCKYFLVSGFGGNELTRLPYGIKVAQTGPGAHGISIANLSTDCEIEHVEIAGADFAGIVTKTDPGCDPATRQGAFSMRNVKIHDNYIHDVKGEGLYLGNSFWSTGMTRTCNGVEMTLFPHNIYGLEVYDNIIERTGAEGLQYACAPDALVHHNIVMNSGLSPFAAYQNNGAQIGGGAAGKFYDNIILNSPATGLIIIGHATTVQVFNNLIINSDIGILCDDRQGSRPNVPMYFLNNTIINCTAAGMRLFNEINTNTVANNLIANVKGRQYFNYYQGAKAELTKNILTSTIDTLKFMNPTQFDFRLKAGSPLIDTGAQTAGLKLTADMGGNTRPLGKSIDVGAFEFINKFALIKPKLLLLLQTLITPAPSGQKIGQLRISTYQDSIQQLTAHIRERNAQGTGVTEGHWQNHSSFEVEKQIKLYPSPATDQITIEFPSEITKIRIYTVEGKCVQFSEIRPALKKVQLLIPMLPLGSYYVHAESTTTWGMAKFLKQ